MLISEGIVEDIDHNENVGDITTVIYNMNERNGPTALLSQMDNYEN